jgi:hypothetical protein
MVMPPLGMSGVVLMSLTLDQVNTMVKVPSTGV